MNRARRKLITDALAAVEAAIADIRQAADEERESYDNLPESIQASERGEKMDMVVSELEGAADELQSGCDTLGGLIE